MSGRRWRVPEAVERLARIGNLPGDSPDEALKKETLVLAASTITALSVVWVVTYRWFGLYVAAAIPFAYQVVSIVNLAFFAKTKRYRFFRRSELSLSLALPFFLQLSLGGFMASSGVVLWSFTAPLGALLFADRREATGWFAAFIAVVAAAAVLDPVLGGTDAEIPTAVQIVFFGLNIVGVTGTCYLLLSYFVRQRDAMASMAAVEHERSERLLLNVLPMAIAQRLKDGEAVIADRVPDAGVLFADIARFTPLSETMSPEDLVRLLDGVFTAFDELAGRHHLEKIKTIGDAYMVASGLLEPRPSHAEDLAHMALSMQRVMEGHPMLELRIGLDVGPVVAGVIGRTKFIYDLWGDTVNTASRMESHGVPGAIQVTERARDRLAERFVLEARGTIDVKGKGLVRTYLLLGEREGSVEAPPQPATP
jgi:adenylate cyclase